MLAALVLIRSFIHVAVSWPHGCVGVTGVVPPGQKPGGAKLLNQGGCFFQNLYWVSRGDGGLNRLMYEHPPFLTGKKSPSLLFSCHSV